MTAKKPEKQASSYRMNSGQAFWGVVYPLTLIAFLLVCLLVAWVT